MSKRHKQHLHRKKKDKRFKERIEVRGQRYEDISSDEFNAVHAGTQRKLLELAEWQLINDCKDIIDFACAGDSVLMRKVAKLVIESVERPEIPDWVLRRQV